MLKVEKQIWSAQGPQNDPCRKLYGNSGTGQAVQERKKNRKTLPKITVINFKTSEPDVKQKQRNFEVTPYPSFCAVNNTEISIINAESSVSTRYMYGLGSLVPIQVKQITELSHPTPFIGPDPLSDHALLYPYHLGG